MADETGAEAGGRSVPLNLDEIMKMMFLLSDKLTIRMINSLFNRNIPLDAKVVPENVEIHRFSQVDASVEEIRADMIVNIGGERFHIEFQTVNDETVVVRIFEYGFMVAIRDIKGMISSAREGAKLRYPKQCVIFVERDDSIPEHELTMPMELWDGEEKEYRVPLVRYWTETTDSLEAKQLEPLIPLQVFKLRKELAAIARSKKPESEKEKLTEAKLREMIGIYTEITDKIRKITEGGKVLTIYHAKQMLEALQHLSEYLYSKYHMYKKIEKEAITVSESIWSFDKWLVEGKKETAHEMFLNKEKIKKIRAYSKLPDKDLASVLREMPIEIQANYKMLNLT